MSCRRGLAFEAKPQKPLPHIRLILALVCAALGVAAQTAPETAYQSGQDYWRLSLQAFNELRTTAPESAYSFALLGEERAGKGQNTAALDAYSEAAKRMPDLRGVHAALAALYTQTGQPSQAADATAAEQKLGEPDCAREKFFCDFASGRFEAVIAAAKLNEKPENLYWRARAYRELAIRTFDELNNLPESSELHKVKARVLREERKYPESIVEWRTALKLSPGDHDLESELATTLFLSQNYKFILPELQQLLKANPASANLNFFVGDSLLETGEAEDAIPYLETALRLDPKLLPAHVALGLSYSHIGDEQKAIPHLQAGLRLDKTGRLYYLLARAYKKTGQPELAKPMLDKYRELQKASSGGSAP